MGFRTAVKNDDSDTAELIDRRSVIFLISLTNTESKHNVFSRYSTFPHSCICMCTVRDAFIERHVCVCPNKIVTNVILAETFGTA